MGQHPCQKGVLDELPCDVYWIPRIGPAEQNIRGMIQR